MAIRRFRLPGEFFETFRNEYDFRFFRSLIGKRSGYGNWTSLRHGSRRLGSSRQRVHVATFTHWKESLFRRKQRHWNDHHDYWHTRGRLFPQVQRVYRLILFVFFAFPLSRLWLNVWVLQVTEVNMPLIPFHWVEATVNVTVKVIPEEAVNKSGSIRFIDTSAEEFVIVQRGVSFMVAEIFVRFANFRRLIIFFTFQGLSKKDILSQQLSLIFNTSLENVDLFTVYSHKNMSGYKVLDVRFSAHGSPYYAAEKLNSLASAKKEEVIILIK